MKNKLLVAVCALSMLGATNVYAGTRYYLAQFKYPGGTFDHCFALTETDSIPGYPRSGTWTDTDFPNTSGQYVVYKGSYHLAGTVGDPNETDYLTLDGLLSNHKLVNTTFDYFTPQGTYLAAGSFVEQADKACKLQS